MQRYRVECNFGCRYFSDLAKATRYFQKCRAKHLDVELWLVNYHFCPKKNRVMAIQHLIDYSGTVLPKY